MMTQSRFSVSISRIHPFFWIVWVSTGNSGRQTIRKVAKVRVQPGMMGLENPGQERGNEALETKGHRSGHGVAVPPR